MNKNLLITPLLALALIAPVSAFAHDGTDDSQESASVHADADANASAGLFGRFAHRIGLSAGAEAQGTARGNNERHASTTPGEGHGRDGQDRHDKVEGHADTAIDTRIESLNKLSARIAGSKLLSTTTIAGIQASLSAEISALNTLKAQIGSDTSSTTLKDDVKSITQDVRVYLLVEPKARIAAAAGRITAVATQLTQLSAKLDTRIDAAADAGVNVSAARAALADLNAKAADAQAQANAAVTLTANLSADKGDKAQLEANITALKSARQKLAAAEADLKAARKDAETIVKAVKGAGVTASSTASVETH